MMMDVKKELLKAQNREEIAKRKISRLKYRLDKLDTAFHLAKDEAAAVSDLQAKLRRLESRNRELSSEVSVWRGRFLDSSAEVTRLNTDLQGRDQELQSRERELERLKARLNKRALRDSREEADTQALNFRLEYLEEERHRSHDQLRQRDLQLDSTRDALQSARTQLMTCQCEILGMDSKIDDLESQKAELERTVAALTEQVEASEALRETLSRTTAELFEARQKLLKHHLAEDISSGEGDSRKGGGVGLLRRATRRVGSWLKLN